MSRAAVRRAKDARNTLRRVVELLDDRMLDRIDALGRFTSVPDGFPAGGSDGGRGSEVARPTEAAVVARNDVEHPLPADPVGRKLDRLFGLLSEAAGVLGPVEDDLEFLAVYGERAVARTSSLAGQCKCCERAVAGGPADPIRNGYCDACRKAYGRWCELHPVGADPAGHRLEFDRARRAELAEREARVS